MSKGFRGGGGGMPGNMQGLLQQAQKLQADIMKAQEKAAELKAEGSSGGRMVVAVANGKNQIESVVIEKQVVNPDDIEMLQDLIVAACNDALNKVQENVKAEMTKLTGGLAGGMPGLF